MLQKTKPSRSDEILEADEQSVISFRIKSHFEALAPRRHRKPNRSEVEDYDQLQAPDDEQDMEIPELQKLQELESRQDHLDFVGDGEHVTEEFVETDYYKDLNSVEKVHHTIGSGFIEMDMEETGSYFRIGSDGQGSFDRIRVPCNPACNDWIPAADDDVGYGASTSNKPERSG